MDEKPTEDEGPEVVVQDYSDSSKHYDRGFAWVVALCAFFLSTTVAINIVSFGVLLAEFAEHFQLPYAYLSVLAAVRTGFTYFTGIISGALIDKYGCRWVSIAGLIFGAMGCLIGAYMGSFATLIVTFGFFAGFGTGLNYIVPLVVIVKYFKKKRVLATGLSSAGFSTGSLVFGLSAGYIIEAMGWRHTLVLMAALNVQTIAAVMWFFPNVAEKIPATVLKVIIKDDNHDTEEDGVQKTDLCNSAMDKSKKKITTSKCKSFCSRIGLALFDVKLLKCKAFAIFAAATLPTMTGTLGFYMLGPNRAYVQGVSKVQSSFVSSAVGSLSFIGRILAGIMGNKKLIRSAMHYSIAATAGSCVILLSTLAGGSLALHLTFAALFGFCLGTYEAIAPAVIVDMLDAKSLSKALGWVQASRGLCAFITLPLAGWLADVSGGFLLPFLFLGALQLLGGVIVFSTRFIKKDSTSSS